MKTILIEKTLKKIKLFELITLAILFASIATGLGLMYLSLPLAIAAFTIATVALIAFIIVRIYRWWHHE